MLISNHVDQHGLGILHLRFAPIQDDARGQDDVRGPDNKQLQDGRRCGTTPILIDRAPIYHPDEEPVLSKAKERIPRPC